MLVLVPKTKQNKFPKNIFGSYRDKAIDKQHIYVLLENVILNNNNIKY